jgi:hypothetical protein
MQQINIGKSFASLASKGTAPYASAPVVPFANLKFRHPERSKLCLSALRTLVCRGRRSRMP